MTRQMTRGAPTASAAHFNVSCKASGEQKWRAALLAGAAALVGLFLVESPARAWPGDYVGSACDRYGSEFNYVYVPDLGMCLARDRFYLGYTTGILGSNASAKFGDGSSSNLMGFGGSQGFQIGYTHALANGWQAGVSANYISSNLTFNGMDVATRVRSFGGVSANFGPTILGGVHPYLAAGAAFARDKFTWLGESASANLIGGSAGFGVEFPLAGSFTGSFEYRYNMYQTTTPFEGGPTFNNNYSTVMVGLNKNFGISRKGIESLWPTYSPHDGYSRNGIGSEWPAYWPHDPPPQLNFFPYIGGQVGGSFVNFQINTNDDPDTRNIHGSGWAAGGFFGADVPTPFPGWSTRIEGDYLATNARATLETMFGRPITKSICGESSINFLGAYRIAAAPAVVAYGGIGAGFVDVTVRTARETDHQNGMAFNMIAGVEYNVSQDWAIGGRYTRVQVEPLDFGRTNVKTDANYIALTATWKPKFPYGNN
jgi:opacity protein-like surface antigen